MSKSLVTNAIAKQGVNYVRTVVEHANCLFHKMEQENDLGIDAVIELIKNEEPVNRQLALQIKSGNSYFDQASKACSIPIGKHRDYWNLHPLPVLGVVYVPSLKTAYWVDIKRWLLNNQDRSVIKFEAARGNQFSEDRFQSIFFPRMVGDVPEISIEDALEFFRSVNAEERRIGLTVLFRKHVNDLRVWSEFFDFFQKADAAEIPPILIYYFAHIPWHPDIAGYGEMPSETTKKFAQKRINEFQKSDIVKLLCMVDDESRFSRGSIGQSVEAVVCAVPNIDQELMSILGEQANGTNVREAAASIAAMHCPGPFGQAIEGLAKDGSAYAKELQNQIRKYGHYQPYS